MTRTFTTEKTQARVFSSGANRNSSLGKFTYKDFINPLNEYSYGKYMDGKRVLADGTIRDGDNWQKGIPKDSLLDSLTRHIKELELLHLGFVVIQYTDEKGEHTEVFQDQEVNEFKAFVEILDSKDIKWHFIELEDVLNAIRFNSEAYKLQVLGYKLMEE